MPNSGPPQVTPPIPDIPAWRICSAAYPFYFAPLSALTPTAGNSITLADAGSSPDGAGNWDGPLLGVYNPAGSQYVPTLGAYYNGSSHAVDTFGSYGGLWALINLANQGAHGAPASAIYVQAHANGDVVMGTGSGTEPDMTLAAMGTNSVWGNLAIGGNNASSNPAFRMAIDPNASRFGQFRVYGGIVTAGIGAAVPYGAFTHAGKTSADSNAINYTPPATAGTYRLNAWFRATTATTFTITVGVTFTDEHGTAQSFNLSFLPAAGTAIVNSLTNSAASTTFQQAIPLTFSIDSSATAITLSTAGTFTTVTYDWGATLEQLA